MALDQEDVAAADLGVTFLETDPAGPNGFHFAADESQWCLYDMDNDRTELHDLSARMPGQVAEMKQRWTEWALQTHVLPWPRERAKK